MDTLNGGGNEAYCFKENETLIYLERAFIFAGVILAFKSW